MQSPSKHLKVLRVFSLNECYKQNKGYLLLHLYLLEQFTVALHLARTHTQ